MAEAGPCSRRAVGALTRCACPLTPPVLGKRTGGAGRLPVVNVAVMTASLASTSAWDEIVSRTVPSAPPGVGALWPAAVVVALVYLLPGARRWGRALTTLVHEAGHAGVGILTGRRFHGFVVERDLSGHAVTSGRSRGPARILTTWAGYPMPAVLGAVMVVAALRGWGGIVAALALLALLVLLVMSRSLRTGALVLLIGALTAVLWWWGDALDALPLRAGLLAGTGLVLLVGAWDSLADVGRSRDGAQDHRTLADLTPLPAWFWLGTWFLVDAAATAAALWSVWQVAPRF